MGQAKIKRIKSIFAKNRSVWHKMYLLIEKSFFKAQNRVLKTKLKSLGRWLFPYWALSPKKTFLPFSFKDNIHFGKSIQPYLVLWLEIVMYVNNIFIALSVLDQIEPSACGLVKADNRNWTYPQLGMALGKQAWWKQNSWSGMTHYEISKWY